MVVGSTVAVSAAGFWLYANHDRLDFIDDPTVADRASAACEELTVQLGRLGAGVRPADRRAAESAAVAEMVASVRSLGERTIDGDHPTRQWLDDWEALAAAHAAGRAVPVDDLGNPIVDRMNGLAVDSGLPECQVPRQLVDG